ncbi:MAG: hypothetical protein R6V50_01340 [Thermoplasmatota archaeon]
MHDPTYIGRDGVHVPDVRLYLNDELYKKWIEIPSGQRSHVMQRLLALYFSCGCDAFLKALEEKTRE